MLPEVAQKNLEENFKAVKDRVLREQLQEIGTKGRPKKLQLEPRREGLVRGEGLVLRGEELRELEEESPSTKSKKSKRWFKKFGSRSMEYECDVRTLHTRAMVCPATPPLLPTPPPLQEHVTIGSPATTTQPQEHIPQPQETQKTRKRWSYRTKKKVDMKLKRCQSVSSSIGKENR